MIYFTADTHFGHKRTLELSRRPFNNTFLSDSAIIHRWTSVVRPTDTVYHLGDFGDVEVAPLLTGNVKFLPGNYDDETIVEALQGHFEVISPNTLFKYNTNVLQLVHEPDEAIPMGHFILFGHIHKLQMVKRNGLNVGVDCHNFTPISLETVLFYKNAIENHYDENVFMETM